MTTIKSMWNYVTLIGILCIFDAIRCDLAGESPRFLEEPLSTVAKLHSPVKLHCHAQPDTVEIKWTLNNIAVETDEDRGIKIEDNGRTLHILSFKHSRKHQPHVGQYRCIVSNNVGTILSRVAILERAYIASFRRTNGSLMNVDVMAGNTAYLPCELPRAVPSAFTVFEVNSTTIDGKSSRYQLLPDGSLQIDSVTSSDQGVYKCIGINTVSGHKRNAKTLINLRVHAVDRQTVPQPVVKPPAKTEVILGQTLTLPCVYSGHPAPTVTWNKYGGRLPSHSRIQLGNLIIENVTQADIGTYLCLSENGVGGMKTEVSQVDVLVPPHIITPLTEQTVLVGGKAVFTCTSRGHPKVGHVWYHNGQPVTADSHLEITNTTLTINNAQSIHEGMYQCMASSKIGQSHSEARLIVKNASSMEGNGTIEEALLTPSVPQVEQVAKTSVRVKWSLYPGPAVRVFVVQYKMARGKWQTAADVSSSKREYTVKKLKPRTKYAFRVNVKYEDGAMRSSEKASLRLVKNVKHLTSPIKDGTPGTHTVDQDMSSRTNTTSSGVLDTTHEEKVIETSRKPMGGGRGGKRGRKKKCRKKNKKKCKKETVTPEPTKSTTDKLKSSSIPKVTQASESSVLLQWKMPRNPYRVNFFKVQYLQKMKVKPKKKKVPTATLR